MSETESTVPAKDDEKDNKASVEAVEKEETPVTMTTRNVVFKQGKCGFHLQLGNEKTGKASEASEQLKVTHVKSEGQAYWAGVKPGWIIRTIDGQGIDKDSRTLTYTSSVKKLLGAAVKNDKYSVTFLIPDESQAASRGPT